MSYLHHMPLVYSCRAFSLSSRGIQYSHTIETWVVHNVDINSQTDEYEFKTEANLLNLSVLL